MGGAAAVNLLLGMVRVKFASVLIGTTGVGLMASLTAIQGLVGTLFGLGIGSSAVREVAAAVGRNDDRAIGEAVLTLRRICWLTGLAGMASLVTIWTVSSIAQIAPMMTLLAGWGVAHAWVSNHHVTHRKADFPGRVKRLSIAG